MSAPTFPLPMGVLMATPCKVVFCDLPQHCHGCDQCQPTTKPRHLAKRGDGSGWTTIYEFCDACVEIIRAGQHEAFDRVRPLDPARADRIIGAQHQIAHEPPEPVATFSGETVQLGTVLNLAQWMESVGRVPRIDWHRGEDGLICGAAVYETMRKSA